MVHYLLSTQGYSRPMVSLQHGMSKLLVTRRGILIADVICFLGFLAFSIPSESGIWRYPQIAFFFIWVLILIVHIAWFNRKSVLTYFSSQPKVSKRGLRQMVIYALAACFTSIVAITIMVMASSSTFTEPIVVWLPLAIAAVILAHVWLNRKPFFYYIGGKTALATWLCGCCLLSLGIVVRVCPT